MKLSFRTLLPMTAMLVAAAGLTACGSDSKTSTNTDSSSTKPASSSTTTATGTVVIKIANQTKFGKIYVDGQGKTVYTLTKDGAAVPCTGGCLTAWPPVMLPAGETTATGGPGVKEVSVVDANGGKQVTYDGKPVYTFSGDAAAGDANGDGLASFGGVWHVVKVEGASDESSGEDSGTGTGSGTTQTTSGSGSGY
jgi:predicted lipoprotein with Yx(FWY)xxD motif